MPGPSRRDDCPQIREPSLEIKHCLGQRKIRYKDGWVARPSGADFYGHLLSGLGLNNIQHLLDRKAAARSEIVASASTRSEEIFNTRDMSVCKIADMHMVPYRRSVRCWIIGAEKSEVCHLSLDRHHRSRYQMRFRVAHLPYFSHWVGATRIEISKSYELHIVSTGIVAKYALYHRLRGAIGVDRRLRHVLAHRPGHRLAIDRAGTRDDDAIAPSSQGLPQ